MSTEQQDLELYQLFRSEMYENFKIHRDALQHYLTLAVAVLGATIAGSTRMSVSAAIGALLLAGPIINTFICVLGMRVCDRYYQGALERVSIVAKLEEQLELNTRRNRDAADVFPNDNDLLPERWRENTLQYSTAESFIRKHMHAGVNRLGRRTFWAVISLKVLLAAAIFSEIV